MKLTAILLFATFLMATVATLRADQLTEKKASDFMTILTRQKKAADTYEKVRAFFAVFDRDADRYITPREMYQVLKKHDEKLTEKEMEEVVRKIDTDRDGRLSPEEVLDIAVL